MFDDTIEKFYELYSPFKLVTQKNNDLKIIDKYTQFKTLIKRTI